jgi:hypothetical protein
MFSRCRPPGAKGLVWQCRCCRLSAGLLLVSVLLVIYRVKQIAELGLDVVPTLSIASLWHADHSVWVTRQVGTLGAACCR